MANVDNGYMPEKENPMKRYFGELKQQNDNAILLFRRGDFYEADYEDAKVVADVCGVTLNREGGNGAYVAGFPYHALDTYLPKLIRAGYRIAICDDMIINPKNEKVMANNVKVADLIGKKIMVKGTANYFVVLSAEGESLSMEFHMGNQAPKVLPMKWAAVQDFFAKGVYVLEGTEEPKAATEEVEEVEDVQPTKPEPKPKAKPKAEEKPKAEPKPKAKPAAKKPEPKAAKPKGGKYTFETYTTSKGKTGARILGVSETDAAYQQASALHASGSYTKDKDGGKHFYLCFGPRYLDAAKQVCELLNQGKSIDDCKAVIDAATEARAQQREESKAKREERKADKPDGKTYTAKEVEGFIRKAFGALAKAMKEPVEQFEPIIKAALPQAA